MNQVAKAYDSNTQRESERLARDPYHSLEFLVTWHYLQKHLPPTGSILDAGGGAGRYALELCRAGYQTVLLDVSSGLLALAREQFEFEPADVRNRLVEFALGDIQDLSRFQANQFDAVLCLGGPLTHISDPRGRQKAMSELVHVAKPNAVVFISVMGYLAVLRTMAIKFGDEIVHPPFQTLVETGNMTGNTGTLWHFFRADELRQLALSCSLEMIEMVGCEGLSAGCAEATNLLGRDEAKWQRWVQVVLQTSAEPSVADMAEHILYIGRAEKKPRDA